MKEHFSEFHKIKTYTKYTARGEARYVAEIQYTALNAVRVITESEPWILETKVKNQFDKWDDMFAKSFNKSQAQLEKEVNQNSAEEKTREYQERLLEIEEILKSSINKDYSVKWDSLIDTKTFTTPNPKNNLSEEILKIPVPKEPEYKKLPFEPVKFLFEPKLSLVDKIFKSKADRKIQSGELLYDQAISEWKKSVEDTENENLRIKKTHENALKAFENEKDAVQNKFKLLESEWETEMDEFYLKQTQYNQNIKKLEELYESKDETAVVEYCYIVLRNSDYPETFPKESDIEYSSEKKFLIVDYVLPTPENFPKVVEVKYIATKREMKETFISEGPFAKMYDTAIYNITLRTLYELFQSDKIDAIDSIVFNGWVNSINRATGKVANSCIVSIQVKKSELIDIDLINVDPKTCFKNLKGLGSSKLIGITAIQPIIKVNKNDKRFVNSHDVSQVLDDSYNLAAMGWEDFEHLIRELFEKEFSTNGGEVKVTQASRDGGVDAIAFDPDPIRGGKIVIQAKRYTNTVGVSAIRDLYGTVLNEGATKGILVTTSDYGPDAYEFAKNKPLTLLSGNNLLYLLEKHGHKARIDLAEAKKILKDM